LFAQRALPHLRTQEDLYCSIGSCGLPRPSLAPYVTGTGPPTGPPPPERVHVTYPLTPDGPPILGLGRHRNLVLNSGHGHMGWTMACGTARIVADLMTGRMPELDLEGLVVRR
jgi:glycine/D-amino acid oxidase-like deaminating enzyme